ncbi:hypothetical protein M0804_001875 [Polistes exclamans]|nr:hypothetical protein M0804_001875 [Polistes exclamans]
MFTGTGLSRRVFPTTNTITTTITTTTTTMLRLAKSPVRCSKRFVEANRKTLLLYPTGISTFPRYSFSLSYFSMET